MDIKSIKSKIGSFYKFFINKLFISDFLQDEIILNRKNVISFFSLSAVFIISLFLIKLLQNSFIFTDDCFILLHKNFQSFIFHDWSDRFLISDILGSVFGSVLPCLLKIHPSDFKSTYFSVIETLSILFFIFIWCKLFYFETKEKIIFKKGFILLFPLLYLLLLFILRQQPWILYSYAGFFRMLVSAFIWVYLYFLLLQDKQTIFHYVSVAIISFLCGVSGEMLCISSSVALSLFVLYSFFSKKNLLKVFLSLIFTLAGMLFLIKTGVFLRKGNDLQLNFEFFSNIVKIIPSYTVCYIKYVFINHCYEFILLLFQSFILYKYSPKTEQKNNILVVTFCFLFGVLTFFYMLIGVKNPHYFGGYWVQHADLHVIFDIMLCSFILVTGRLLYKYNLIKFNGVVFILYIISILFLAYQNNFYYKHQKNYVLEIRNITYKTEKILRISAKQHKIAYIDKAIFENPHCWHFLTEGKEKEVNYKYETSYYINFINQFLENKINDGFIFTDSEKAEEEFKKNSGYFSDEELKNIKFQNLTK